MRLFAKYSWLVLAAFGAIGGCGDSAKQQGNDASSVPDSNDGECDPACTWDCFGGSQCVDGTAWVNYYAAVPCCHAGDPWPEQGPECGSNSRTCSTGQCNEPEPRYAGCLKALGSPEQECENGECELLGLYCAEGAVKTIGNDCTTDADCRPAAEGVVLRCDSETAKCVEAARPVALAVYGSDCGLDPSTLSGLVGEAVTRRADPETCPLCHVYKESDTCIRQACTQACTFDEDCPDGSVCLCGTQDNPNSNGYCAAATDRETAAGRAAGLPECVGGA